MVQLCAGPPLGGPTEFPIRLTAASGVQVIYGYPYSRQPPGSKELLGIGIKMRRPKHVQWDEKQYPDWDSSWAGLFDQKLHELFWNFKLRDSKHPDGQPMVLHLPMMGMPPREPSKELMRQARRGEKWTRWFRYAYVFKATDIVPDANGDCQVIVNRERKRGDDVVIRLPRWPAGPRQPPGSLFRQTDESVGFEFRTALPVNDDPPPPTTELCLENLYFVQLLPNELPSYHFFADPTACDHRPGLHPDVRTRPDGAGSPHASDPAATPSLKQKTRSPVASGSPRRSSFALSPTSAEESRR